MEETRSASSGLNRREFLRMGVTTSVGVAMAGAGLSTLSASARTEPKLFTAPKMERVRMGFVGVGNMGTSHVRNFLKIEGVDIRAICDIVPEKVELIQTLVAEARQPTPAGYSRGERDFVRMCETEDLDVVFTATPWQWHVPVCVAAMENGKHAATEVPASTTLEGCWELVETAEKQDKHCVMMENCCYDRAEMLIFHLVRKGLLGEIFHGECGYLHDCRALKFSGKSEGEWRLAEAAKRNGNLYPTHGLGPIAQCMDINRGDRLDYLVSMSSPSLCLSDYAARAFGAEDPRAKRTYALGDINVSLIHTVKGKTITLSYDTCSPRPYSRATLIQGTRGLARRWPDEIFIEGKSPSDGWEPMEDYYAEHEHPLWKAKAQEAQGAGHGGMDYIEDDRLIRCLREGWPTDMDVYDAAAWSSVCELSERSVADRSRPKDFPDFTRNAWKARPAMEIIEG